MISHANIDGLLQSLSDLFHAWRKVAGFTAGLTLDPTVSHWSCLQISTHKTEGLKTDAYIDMAVYAELPLG